MDDPISFARRLRRDQTAAERRFWALIHPWRDSGWHWRRQAPIGPPKSLAQELHADAISVDGSPRGKFSDYPVVKFEHFSGVTPRRYREYFERGKRKRQDGSLQNYINGRKRPNIRIVQPYYIESEKLFIRDGYGALEATVKQRTK